jgi:hypothetical protein
MMPTKVMLLSATAAVTRETAAFACQYADIGVLVRGEDQGGSLDRRQGQQQDH